MTNLLLVLAIIGMLAGAYAIAMPTLTRRGWRLPLAGFFSQADEDEDEPFKTAFEMPRHSDVDVAADVFDLPPLTAPLPPVLRPESLLEEEDDPTLTPLFESLDTDEPVATANVQTPSEAAGPATSPVPSLVTPTAQEPVPAAEAAPEAEPTPSAELALDPNDMLALFSESPDAAKGPNIIREAVGDVSAEELMAQVNELREIIRKRAA